MTMPVIHCLISSVYKKHNLDLTPADNAQVNIAYIHFLGEF